MPYIPSVTPRAPGTAVVLARKVKRGRTLADVLGSSDAGYDRSPSELGHCRYETQDDGAAFGDDDGYQHHYIGDELGFSFNPFRVVKNVARAVTKGVGDVAAEARRAARNPLIQGVASFVPGGGLVTRGLNAADSLTRSRFATTAAAVDRATVNAPTIQAAAENYVAQRVADAPAAVVRAATDARAARRAAAAAKKAAEGAAIQAAAEKATADRTIARAKRAADKAAEGERIQAANAERAKRREAAKAKAKEEADRAAKLQADALKAAQDGNDVLAAQLREQAAAATSNARIVSTGAGVASVAEQSQAGGPVYSAAVQTPGEVTAGPSTKTLAIGAGVLGVAALAFMRGGGSSRTWR